MASSRRRWRKVGSVEATTPQAAVQSEDVDTTANRIWSPKADPTSSGGRRCALVTGSNKGIGFQICRLLLQEGVEVIATARDQDRGQEALARLRAGPGSAGLLGFICLDVRDETSVAQLRAAVDEILPRGHLDILVNNAGIAFPDATFGREEANETVDINALGTIRVTRALLPLLEAAPSGRVVNVSSGTSGSLGKAVTPMLRQKFLDPNLTDGQLFALMDDFVEACGCGLQKERGWTGIMYDVSKLAVNSFSIALARELLSSGSRISVTCNCPGFVKTDMCDSCYGPGSGKISAAQGADTPVWLALLPDHESLECSGYFFRRRAAVKGRAGSLYFW